MISLFVFIIGLFVGSFIALCAGRLPRKEPVVFDISRCDYCRSPIRWPHKLPVIGALFLRWKTACCKRPIPFEYTLIEILTGVGFSMLFAFTPSGLDFIYASLFFTLLTISFLTDLKAKLIPDKITLTGIVAGLIFTIFLNGENVLEPLLGMLFCGGFLLLGGIMGKFILHQTEAIGGGDIKMAAMIGVFLGWEKGFFALMVAIFTATIYGSAKLVWNSGFRKSREIPLGPFLATAALFSLLTGEYFIDKYYALIGESFL